MRMQSEPERLDDDEVYELDREAWNLPRPRAQLGIASTPEAPPDDRSGYGPHVRREAERAT
jgi:hypothetical protein